MEAKGTIGKVYTATCGRPSCNRTIQQTTRTQEFAEKAFRAEGWSKTKKYGWICGECAGRRCKCGGPASTTPHTCPYAEDVHGDSDTLCLCCDDCTDACAQDI